MDIIFVYHKEGKIRCLNLKQARVENDKLINEIWEAKTSKEEILKKIPFETLDKFLSFLSNKGDYRFRII